MKQSLFRACGANLDETSPAGRPPVTWDDLGTVPAPMGWWARPLPYPVTRLEFRASTSQARLRSSAPDLRLSSRA